MSDGTAIEWTDATWNPVTGCTPVSEGCDHCYAKRIYERFHGKGSFEKVELHPDRLDAPLHWRKARTVFVNSMSDLFQDDVPAHFIASVFEVMARSQEHTFQVLTKRPGRMASFVRRWVEMSRHWFPADPGPPPNVWLGISVETQKWADVRIPKLLETPAAVRFLSCEPLLGPIHLDRMYVGGCNCGPGGEQGVHESWCGTLSALREGIDWVIVGGESGPGARPMHPDWVRDVLGQCVAAGVPFFFKGWGGRTPKAGGRELDGRTWNQYPTPTPC